MPPEKRLFRTLLSKNKHNFWTQASASVSRFMKPVIRAAPSTTVTGLESSLSEYSLANREKIPVFVKTETIKNLYVDELRVCIEMIKSYASNEKPKLE